MSTTIQNLAQRQVMLSFAYLAYTGENFTTPEQENTMLGLIQTAMPQIPPLAASPWKIVWYAAPYTVPGALYQDNFMFVAQNIADPSQYAVAIRGTNFVSNLNWFMEDFDVLQMMPWPLGNTNNPAPAEMVSESTSIGMNVLLSMLGSTPGSSTAPTNLHDFLLGQTQNGGQTTQINVCVTGHSLGGMLAGTMALYLSDNQSSWDASNQSTISCITFAAPTAGNQAFAAYSDQAFSGKTSPPNWDTTLGSNCDAVRCDLDVAPLFSTASNISQSVDGKPYSPLFAIYGANIDFDNLTFKQQDEWGAVNGSILPMLASILTSRGYTQIVSGAAQVQGTFKPLDSFDPPIDITSSFHNSFTNYLKAFGAEAGWQHSDSYPNILLVPALLSSGIIVRSVAQ
jgi:hypothetical protein